ncbi:outer membrane protein assembly factor BamE [Maritimibacter sp. UBA3975]|uniref:outer membrane protein assembly factor BamE n=1 Tax=Maritimibacter sp. UBA3975 TaxID=1946833 RepID=UPI000C099A3F|nr:outer membrane protein assembly factor BamE [Maritimibacter sp. UBA3975]MAM62414.1 cell envelope protein SmpA [Maritimibacter sp.]|tara:strand:- start:39827 stop:40297 length:471 start_codon:yes stop_codon:yes gene_type:complete
MTETGTKAGRVLRAIAVLAVVGFVSACTPIYSNHGYLPTDQDVEEIMVGVDTRETVGAIVGRPGAEGLLTQEAWYYVQSRFEQVGYQAKEEIDREVLRISFTEDGLVENIERFGLEEGRVVTLSRRVTTSNTAGIGFIRQLLGNIGRINLDNILGN